MGDKQVFAAVVWGYDEKTKTIKVKIPHIFTSKPDCAEFIRLNKDPQDKSVKWELHSTMATIKDRFYFPSDVVPNYK